MRSGQLRDYVKIVRRDEADEGGFLQEQWKPFLTLPARFDPRKGGPVFRNGLIIREKSDRFIVRFRTDLLETDAIVLEEQGVPTRYFKIQVIIDPDRRRQWLHLEAVEVDTEAQLA